MHRLAIIGFIVFLFTTIGYAQIPSGNVFVGYSYLSTDLGPGDRANWNGWNGSVEGKVLPFIGIVADLSGHYGSLASNSTGLCTVPPGGLPGGCLGPLSGSGNQHNFLFGPRASVSLGKFRPFAHVLLGASHISESSSGFSNSGTSFAYAVGGGIDYHLAPLIGWRLQADLLQTRFFSTTQNNARVSTGIVIHF